MISCIQDEFNKPRRNWKSFQLLNYIRLLYLSWRGEKWIQRLWADTKCTWTHFQSLHNTKFWCYALLNTHNRYMYIGQTSQFAVKRYITHFHDFKSDVNRRIYRNLKKHGIESWILFPLEKFENKNDLYVQERFWMHTRRSHLINDPTSNECQPRRWDASNNSYSIARKPDLRPSQIERVRQRQLLQEKVRGRCKLVFTTTCWKKWATSSLLQLLNNFKAAHLRLYQWHYSTK
jgi:hypothetical protein